MGYEIERCPYCHQQIFHTEACIKKKEEEKENGVHD